MHRVVLHVLQRHVGPRRRRVSPTSALRSAWNNATAMIGRAVCDTWPRRAMQSMKVVPCTELQRAIPYGVDKAGVTQTTGPEYLSSHINLIPVY
jgi:hypothetical protein